MEKQFGQKLSLNLLPNGFVTGNDGLLISSNNLEQMSSTQAELNLINIDPVSSQLALSSIGNGLVLSDTMTACLVETRACGTTDRCSTSDERSTTNEHGTIDECSTTHGCSTTDDCSTTDERGITHEHGTTDEPNNMNDTLTENSSTSEILTNSDLLYISIGVDVQRSNLSTADGTTGCLSPLTPNSKFDKCILHSSAGSSLIIASVLCNWDNIFGPRVHSLWLTEHDKCPELTLDLLNFVANQTLSGEITRDPENASVDLKLYMTRDKGIIMATLVFGAVGKKKEMTLHSLSLIFPYELKREFLVWKSVCLEWMQRSVQFMRIELTKGGVDETFNSFKNRFSTFITTIESAKCSSFPKKIELIDTVLHPHHVFDAEFIQKAISAHLLQCQQSIVIGHSVAHINLMCKTLSLFFCPHRKHLWRPLTDNSCIVYSPEFSLQGFLSSDASLCCTLRHVYYSRYPTALIDMTTNQVSILCIPSEYGKRRRKFMIRQLSDLMTDKTPPELTEISCMFEDLNISFSSCISDDTLVGGFLKQFHSLPLTHGVREAFTCHFMSFLQRSALLFIQVTEEELRKKGSIQPTSLVPKLRNILSIKHDCDYWIVLSTAELLKPGLIEFVVCDTESSKGSQMKNDIE